MDDNKAPKMALDEKTIFHSWTKNENTPPSRNDRAMPIVAPIRQTTTDSTKNCFMMSDRLAPMAIRMPISRVLSDTDTSMMFMTPMPPTSKDTAAMTESIKAMARVVLS